MKNLKLLTLSALVLVGVLAASSNVLADAAPPSPGFPSTALKVKVNVGSLSDRFVVIHYSGKYNDSYQVVNGAIAPDSYLATAYFALDKKYFKDAGGLDGIFSSTPNEEYGGMNMALKNETELNAQKYNFVLKQDDPLTAAKFVPRGDEDTSVRVGSYVSFPFHADFYLRQGADDPSCNTGYQGGRKNCILSEKTVVYMPQEVVGHNIVLASAESIAKQAQVKKEIKAPEAVAQPVASAPTQSRSRWNRAWKWVKSLF